MAGYYVPLGRQQISNSLIDFSPVNQGLNAIGQAKQQVTENALADRKMQLAEGADARQARQWETEQAQRAKMMAGKEAFSIHQMPDTDPRKKLAWDQYVKRHGDGNHTPEELDFKTGPLLAITAAGLSYDPIDRQIKEAELGLAKARTAQAYQKAEPDPIKQFITDKLRRAQQPQGAAQQVPPAVGGVQRQSFDGANGIPGLQLAADGTEAAPPQIAAPDMVDTPFGKMGRNEARDLGSTLLLDPRYATAGKAILDAVDGPNQGAMGKTAQNQIEEKTLNNAAMLARLGDIGKRFDAKFLEIPTRLKMMGASWSAKAGEALGGKLSTEQRSELSRFAQFRSASVNNLNTILKELSGAAVTPQEYERLKNDVPQAGTGIFDGDDPVSFKAKLDRAQQTARSAIARYNFMRSKGLNFDRNSLDQFLSLDDVPAAYNQRGAELRGELQKSGADPKTIDQQVRKKLKQEFGI